MFWYTRIATWMYTCPQWWGYNQSRWWQYRMHRSWYHFMMPLLISLFVYMYHSFHYYHIFSITNVTFFGLAAGSTGSIAAGSSSREREMREMIQHFYKIQQESRRKKKSVECEVDEISLLLRPEKCGRRGKRNKGDHRHYHHHCLPLCYPWKTSSQFISPYH